MKKSLLLRKGAFLAMVAMPMFLMTSCQQDLADSDHYKAPDFLVGNAIEVLQKDGTYTTFLRGIELIGYNDVVSTQLLTVLAPTDEAFQRFLSARGYSSIDDLYAADPVFVKELITYHLIYFAMDWDKMVNFRPSDGDGATEADKTINAGMYNRFRTRCQKDMTTEYNSAASVRDNVQVVHYDRYLTVFSEKLFTTLGLDAASNYNYFFPGSTWNPNHLSNGFNVMNAAVLDTEAVVTDNGYLYHIDQVIEPVSTIYDELSNRSDYQMFSKLFNQYKYYGQDITESEKRGFPVYSTHFNSLPDIANEWSSSSFLDFTRNSYVSYNIIAPTDAAMNKMFSDYWEPGCGYTSVETLNPLIQLILLNECLMVSDVNGDGSSYNDYMCYPAFIDNGRALSKLGTLINLPSTEFDNRLVCNNGVIFGATSMSVPGVMGSAIGPAFKDVRYLNYLYTLYGSSLIGNYSSNATNHVTLIPDTAQFRAERMRLFRETVDGVSEYTLQQWNDEAGDYTNMGGGLMRNIVNMNTADEVSELPTTGTAVIETNVSYNYWFIRDGKITTNALFNQQLNPTFTDEIWYPFQEIQRGGGQSWSNGRSYAYSYPGIYQPVTAESLETELSQNNDRNYPYYCFAQLLRLSGLSSDGAFVTTGANTVRIEQDMNDNRFIAFVPTNDAIRDNLNSLPGCANLNIDPNTYAISGRATQAQLAAYLLSYFIVRDRNSFTSYPYVGSSCKGEFETGGTFGLRVVDNGTSLSITATGEGAEGVSVPVVDKYYYLPFAFSDGAFQLVDGVLK